MEGGVLLFHANITTRGHNTNNFIKATIHVLKDVVVSRTRAFNAVALVDAVAVWLLGRMQQGAADSMEPVGNNVYAVLSATHHSVVHEVSSGFGACRCPVVTSIRLLKGLRQLSPDTQTFSLESFHNVLNGFARKSTAFSLEGMLCRTRLAALHFNENAERAQAITKDGYHQGKVKTPTASKEHHVVCPVKTDTHGYVQELMAVAVGMCGSSSFLEKFQATRTPPKPNMSNLSERPSKKDLIDSRVSRFAKAKPQIV
ncbi:uncharacterized protein LOC121838519 [Ixodes scapularis]|uniref:uncharacterized protein LOC121838519 n=1 Tax=Ixodes scapularis TaxID=6945 RepID=UPI001C382276|nr:uncharacterized protein LOC121838519 [Ixodes scapularis]